MTVNNAVMTVVGVVIMVSLLLGASISPYAVNENWLWLTAFAGFMSFQSAFTGFCPAALIFKAFGLKDSDGSCCK
jgi:hypothetical protein